MKLVIDCYKLLVAQKLAFPHKGIHNHQHFAELSRLFVCCIRGIHMVFPVFVISHSNGQSV